MEALRLSKEGRLLLLLRRDSSTSRQTSYMLGREREVAAGVHVNHPPLSKQHAVLQYRALPLWEERGRILCSH